MSHRKTMYRLCIAVLATTALAAPAAIAMPIDPGSGGTATDPRQNDMHASTVKTPAVQQEHRTPDAIDRSAPKPSPTFQEQRTPDAIDRSAPKPSPTFQDLRTPDALDQSPVAKPEPIPAGVPTWPVNPHTLPQPAVVATDGGGGDGGGGVDWAVPAIVLAACLALGGAVALTRTRLRTAAH